MSEPILMLVDDNSDDVELMRLALRDCGVPHELVVCRDGQAALDWFRDRAGDGGRAPGPAPALVLLDVRLPDLDGHEVLKALRADSRGRQVPVVLLSTSCQASDVDRAYALGANAYLGKPIGFQELLALTRSVCQFWLVHNRRHSILT